MDGPTFSERSERKAEPTDVHGVDNRQRTLGASPKRARSGSRRLERRDIKAEIDVHLFCYNEDTVPSLPPSTVVHRDSRPSMH